MIVPPSILLHISVNLQAIKREEQEEGGEGRGGDRGQMGGMNGTVGDPVHPAERSVRRNNWYFKDETTTGVSTFIISSCISSLGVKQQGESVCVCGSERGRKREGLEEESGELDFWVSRSQTEEHTEREKRRVWMYRKYLKKKKKRGFIRRTH